VTDSPTASDADTDTVHAYDPNQRIRGTAPADWLLMVLGPLFASVVAAFAVTEGFSGQKALAIGCFLAFAGVGVVRRCWPRLSLIGSPLGIGMVVSRSVRIPVAFLHMERAGLAKLPGGPRCGIRLRDPDALVRRLRSDLERDMLRIVHRGWSHAAGEAPRTLGDAMRRSEQETGFHLLFSESELGVPANAAANAMQEQIVKCNWARATAEPAARART
jgi:hypothetical protein